MKTTVKAILCLLLSASAASVSAVMVGDAKELVLAQLGYPDGYLGTPGREVLMYERGEVVLEEGIVVSAELISEEQAYARRLQREAAEAERLERERVRREQLGEEGTEIRLRKLADAEFMNGSATRRVAFWRQFKRTYPMVELGDEYAAALRERELELAAENAAYASQARIRELEMQVAQAESTAAGAYYGDSISYARAAVPVVYGGTYLRRSRWPLYVGGSGTCSRGHTHCSNASCRAPSRVERFDSSAGYAFQRAQKSSSVRVHAGFGSSSCSTGARITPFHSTAGYATQRALLTTGGTRPFCTPGRPTLYAPVSRAGLSASARITF